MEEKCNCNNNFDSNSTKKIADASNEDIFIGQGALLSHAFKSYDSQPPDINELGRASWTLLHTMAASYPEKPNNDQKQKMLNFINSLAEFYPCYKCKMHFRQQVIDYPPNVNSRNELSNWFCTIHNNVNKINNKPLFDCSQILKRWKM